MSEKGVRPQPARKTNYLIFIYVIERDFEKHSTELDESSSALPCLLYPLLNRTHIVYWITGQRNAIRGKLNKPAQIQKIGAEPGLMKDHTLIEDKELEIQKPLLNT